MCCTECAYPGAPGVCLEAGLCPCHDPDVDLTPPPTVERIALAASRYDGDDNQAVKLTVAAIRRLEWRKRHAGKVCASCRETKPVSAYGRSAREADGLNPVCKTCRNSYERGRVNG